MKTNYYTLDEAASFLTEALGEKIIPDAVLRFAASRESELDLCIYFHGALEFQLENIKEGGLWPSFYISNGFRGYIKIPVDAIHPDRDEFSPFPYARIIEELSNGLLTDPSAEKVLFPTLYVRRIEPLNSSPAIPFHPQDEITVDILLEPLIQEPIPVLFEASRSKSLITKKSLLNFLAKNQITELTTNTKSETVLVLSIGKGITSQQVVDAFYGLHYDSRGKWKKYVGDPPEWLKKCRLSKGIRGSKNESGIWNPVEIALALLDKGISEEKLNHVFKKPILRDWINEWKEKTYNNI